MNQPLYWNNSLLTEEDFPLIAQRHKLSYDLVVETIAQICAKGEPLYAQYATGVTRDRIRAVANEISFSVEDEFEAVPDYSPQPSHDPVPHPAPEALPQIASETFEPAPRTELQDVVSDAAGKLIEAMADPGHGHFILTPDGCCAVNPESPPELPQAYQVVSNVIKLKELGPAVDDKSSWMLGSIVSSLEDFFGEEFSVSQVCDLETKSYNTIATAVGVFKAFKNKRYNVSFTHHKEVHYAKIPDEAKKTVLSKAETYKLGAKQCRDLCSIVKRMDGDDTVIRNIRSQDQALSLIEAYREAKVPYLVYSEGAWTRQSGLAGEVPVGKVVLDLKNWKAYIDGQSTDIAKSK